MATTEERLEQLEKVAHHHPDTLATKDDLRTEIKKLDDKIEARFQSLHTLIFRYLLTDDQREDWNRRKNGST
ncbi:MAG: hypothetical protein J4F43_10360 [Dehalococcoidia bacterium]|nr:hypothetical protein [Dehalococcoidia bacterium]